MLYMTIACNHHHMRWENQVLRYNNIYERNREKNSSMVKLCIIVHVVLQWRSLSIFVCFKFTLWLLCRRTDVCFRSKTAEQGRGEWWARKTDILHGDGDTTNKLAKLRKISSSHQTKKSIYLLCKFSKEWWRLDYTQPYNKGEFSM